MSQYIKYRPKIKPKFDAWCFLVDKNVGESTQKNATFDIRQYST